LTVAVSLDLQSGWKVTAEALALSSAQIFFQPDAIFGVAGGAWVTVRYFDLVLRWRPR
jgi:hypothetical protein